MSPSLRLDELVHCSAVFLPADPPRAGRIAFWSPEDPPASAERLTVVGDDVRPRTVPAVLVPVRDALPLLTRARFSDEASPAAAFWGAASLLALHLAAQGLLLPGLTATDRDAWRAGPLGADELADLRSLAASMPPAAHAVPLPGDGPLRLPQPEALLRAFVDAVVDGLPRTSAAPLAAGGPAFAADEPQELPAQRGWAADVAAGHDAGVRLSLRLELPGLSEQRAPAFRAVLQMHGVADPALVADAAEVWAGSGPAAAAFGPRARMDALLALRRAARAWSPLAPLLSAAVPDAVE
ncbi:ATP-dependent helicase, partial [Streptomyces sp. NPDC047981]